MSVQIVRATVEHLELVAPLFDAYRQFYGCSPDLAIARAFLRERLEREESVVFLALQDSSGIGFTQLYPTFTSVGVGRAWILNDLFVAPATRRSGVGRQLMEAARLFAVETGAAWLELATAKDNERAKALYRSCGYKVDQKFDRFKLTLK
jgi:GNAT superfamily N-acetyltransferase